MSDEKIKIGIPFDEFLSKATNLLTVFGIFNALLLFSKEFGKDDEEIAFYVFTGFYLLSLLVWFEVIRLAIKSSDDSIKYHFFILCSTMIELALAYYFFRSIYGLIAIVLISLAILYSTIVGYYFLAWIVGKFINIESLKFRDQNSIRGLTYILTLLLIIPLYKEIIFPITRPYVLEFFKTYLKSLEK